VSAPLPLVTVVIPTRPGDGEPLALQAARALDYPRDRLEWIVARGKQPSVQRNVAVRSARGEWIYFLDDDALPRPDNLRRAFRHAERDAAVKMVGGPNLCPADAPTLERVFAVVLSSFLAFFSSRARYASVGKVRASGEKELILCNLLCHKSAFLDAGGFDELLYPNEENALMDTMQRGGATLLYDPDFVVQRRPRSSIRAFARMVFTYGRGRAEQFRLHPTLGSLPNFAPPLLCLYLILLPFLGWLGLVPLGVYLVALLGQGILSACSHGFVLGFLSLPFVVLTHTGYGLGFWRGLFTAVKPPSGVRPTVEVQLQRWEAE
jgi:succinoglycan biosynthesis protein ExoA